MQDLIKTAEQLISLFVINVVPPIFGALALLVFGGFGLRFVVRFITAVGKRARVKPAIIDLSRAAVGVTGWIIIIASILQLLGLNQIALALGGSISLVALGIATAASGNLGDIIAGIFLASDPDFGTGFTISSGKLTGIIEHIDLRKTRIRTADGKLHVIPNKMIESDVWQVEGRPESPPPLFRIQRQKQIAQQQAQQSHHTSEHPNKDLGAPPPPAEPPVATPSALPPTPPTTSA